MSSFLSLSLLAISLATTAFTKPLSTSPYYAPRQRAGFSLAPLMSSEHPHGSINDSYIVMLKADVPATIMTNHMNFLMMAQESDPLLGDGSGVSQIYDGDSIKGYAGKFTEGVLQQIRSMPEVDFVEKDQIVRTMEMEIDTDTTSTQKGAPWVSRSAAVVCCVRFADVTRSGTCPRQSQIQVDLRHIHSIRLRQERWRGC